MATLEDLKRRIAEAELRLNEGLETIAELAGANTKALAERNILERGIGFQYSTNTGPAFWLRDKEINQRGTRYIDQLEAPRLKRKKIREQNKTAKTKRPVLPKYDPEKELGNWAGLRGSEGLQNMFVDLHHSNKMFAGIGVLRVEKRGNAIVAIMGNNNVEGQNKMNWNYARYGDFIDIALGDEGREFIGNFVQQKVDELLATIII